MIQQTMQDPLGEYVRTGSNEAFQCFVETHINSVYSQCLRQLRDPAAAQDVTQQVFISLAQKAAKLSPDVVLEGWLFTATRYCCANQLRAAGRRRIAERKAAIMRKEAVDFTSGNDDFASQAEPLLDDAIARLDERDRNAVLLRFFRGQSLREVGNALGVSEDAAKQRVTRAVEKLRIYFARRRILASSEMVASALGCVVKPAAPHAVRAVLSVVLSRVAQGPAPLPKVMSAGSRIGAGLAAACAIIAAGVVVSHIALAQAPGSQSVPPAQSAPLSASVVQIAPATQPYSQATPIDTLSKLCAAMESNDARGIDDCVCSDGTNRDQADLGRILFEGEGVNYRISKAWKDKFGQALMIPGFGLDAFADHHTVHTALRAMLDLPGGPQSTIDGDIAQVRIGLPAEYFAGSGPDRSPFLGRWSGATLVFNRVGRDWKLNTDRTVNVIVTTNRMDGNEDDILHLAASIEQGIADSLNDVAAKIENGAIHSPTQGARAVQTKLVSVFQTNRVNGANLVAVPVIGG
jgi:RNA polymerase sigma factor (sigma-70 family)